MASTATDQTVLPKAGLSDLQSLLLENTTRKYYIEYNGFLSNHISHAIIALYRLGATVEQTQRFIDWYQQRLESSSPYMDHIDSTNREVSDLLGARKDYYVLVDHYETQLKAKCDNSLEKLIAEAFPLLCRGLAGSALHGLIQLGYGYAAKTSRLVCEGLAYLHFSYIAPQLSNAAASSARANSLSPVEVICELQNNVELHSFVNNEKKKEEWRKINTSNFQRSVGILFRHRGDYMYELAQSVKLPDVSPSDRDAGQQLGMWLVNTALTVYVSSSRYNDFFLLHGVTGAWSLLQILPVISDYHAVISAVHSYLCTLFTVYVAQGTLDLQLDRLHHPPEKSLLSIVRDILSESMKKDEHVLKLIQVCSDMYKETTDPALRNMYTWAAYIVVSYPLTFE